MCVQASSSFLHHSEDSDESACEVTALRRHQENKIQIGVILPLSGNHPYRMQLTRPAVEYARDYVLKKTDLLRNFTMEFDYRDSQCSETYGPLEAIDMYTKKSADLFLGPACDYAIAVVARFTPTWGIPIISAGAQAAAFGKRETYGLLTRVLGSYNKSAEFVVAVLRHFGYENVGMLFHNFISGKSECYFIMEPIFMLIQEVINREFDKKHYDIFTDNSTPADFEEKLKDLSKKCRGKQFCYVCCCCISEYHSETYYDI